MPGTFMMMVESPCRHCRMLYLAPFPGVLLATGTQGEGLYLGFSHLHSFSYLFAFGIGFPGRYCRIAASPMPRVFGAVAYTATQNATISGTYSWESGLSQPSSSSTGESQSC